MISTSEFEDGLRSIDPMEETSIDVWHIHFSTDAQRCNVVCHEKHSQSNVVALSIRRARMINASSFQSTYDALGVALGPLSYLATTLL